MERRAGNASAGAAGEIKLPFTLPQSASDRGAGSLGVWPGHRQQGSRAEGGSRPRLRARRIRGGACGGTTPRTSRRNPGARNALVPAVRTLPE